HPDLWRRSREDGCRRPDCRGDGRRHHRREHGLPCAEDREAQRRLQPDARARARGDRHRRDGEGGEDSGHREDARRLERSVAQRAGARVAGTDQPREARGRERWVINKLRALCAWYSKGIDAGSHFRVRVNTTSSLPELREAIYEFFFLHSAVTGVLVTSI